MTTLGQHALSYAAQGYEVFPLNADKTPLTRNGMKDATSDIIQVERWWNEHPDALIGCRIPADQLVLDIDPRHGGDKVWNELTAQYGDLGLTKQHHSGRNDNGFHAWFTRPAGKLSTASLTEWAIDNGVATLLDTPGATPRWTSGIDILHHNLRYTILPPSPHAATGLPYEWDATGEPSELHGKLAQLLEPPVEPPAPPPRPTLVDGDSVADWYTANARWADILRGWTIAHGDGESDGSRWRHPAATSSWSATIKHGCLFVYSPNTAFHVTEDGYPRGYTKFRAYATLHHNGDMSAAGRAARDMRGPSAPNTTTSTPPPAPTDGEPPADEPWPDPVPLQGQRECPPFPTHVLPDWMADMAVMVAEEMQYPPDLPAQLAITAASICLSRYVTVQVDGPWEEGTNIYTVTAMHASAGKSPAFKHMLAPIHEYEVLAIEASAKDVEDREVERKLIEKQRDDAMRTGDGEFAKDCNDRLRQIPPIVKPRLIAEDITPEKLAMMLHEQDGRMALMSTEGGLFQIMGGRYTDASNLDVFLQAWSGDTVSQDRVGRDSLVIRNPRLVVGLTVQPMVIEQIGDNGEFAGRGLLARFMYAMPPSTVGKRDKRRRSTWNPEVAERYADGMRNLLTFVQMKDCRPRLRLSDEAHAAFVDWQQSHEDRMGYNGDLEHIAEWVSKMHSSVCRLAAIMHMIERGAAADSLVPLPMEIPEDVMLRAMVVGDYWEAHAKIAGDLWGADPEVGKAVRLLRWAEAWVASGKGDSFTLRDVMRGLRKLFPKAESAVPALQILVDSGWVRADLPPHEWGRGRGGQSVTLKLTPKVGIRDMGDNSPVSVDKSASCGKVVTQVTHVPKGELRKNYLLPNNAGMGGPWDMGDMGDNPPNPSNPTPSDETVSDGGIDPETPQDPTPNTPRYPL